MARKKKLPRIDHLSDIDTEALAYFHGDRKRVAEEVTEEVKRFNAMASILHWLKILHDEGLIEDKSTIHALRLVLRNELRTFVSLKSINLQRLRGEE